jgi:basic membrane protein A
VHVKWSNTWYDPGIEGTVAKALLDEGVDVLTQHQDSTAAVMAAKERGAYAIGYHSDMAAFAPDTVLTTPLWKWAAYYTQRIKAAQDGTWKSHSYWGSLADGVVDLGAWGNKVPQAVKDEVAEKRSALVAGTFDVFDGPLKKQDGSVWVDEGARMTDAQMLSMTELVEGVVGEVPAE